MVVDRSVVAWGLVAMLGACGPSVGDGTPTQSTGSATETTAGSSGPGQTGGMEGSSTLGLDSSGGSVDTGAPPLPSTCPAEADLQSGECPSQGETCAHGDFACQCVCGCEAPAPGEQGWYQCDYARLDAWTAEDVAVHLDCDAGTIRSTVSSVFDNADGASAVDIVVQTPGGYFMVPRGGTEETICGGLCVNGNRCPEYPSSIPFGGFEALDYDFEARPCDRLSPSACGEFCGGMADFTIRGSIEIDGIVASLGPLNVTGAPIVCD
ncbi:MAG: hypothetical protein AAF799_07275 [Myxococcota bacterium]